MAVKIDRKRTPQSTLRGKNSSDNTKPIRNTQFVDAVEQVERNQSVEDIELLLQRVKEQSERVRKRIDIQELVEYKRRVKSFLDHCVKHAMKFERDSHLDRYGNHKIYAIVKRVNEELDTLTQMVLAEEKEAIKILKKLDEVQGLLLDVYM